MPNKKLDRLGDAAAAVLANDDEIRDSMRRLVKAMIKDAQWVLKYGAPSERQRLFAAVMPALLRSMSGADANADEAAERQAYQRMLATMRGESDAA